MLKSYMHNNFPFQNRMVKRKKIVFLEKLRLKLKVSSFLLKKRKNNKKETKKKKNNNKDEYII